MTARSQRGVTLLISLIMLVVLSLFAAAMIRLSSTNMLIAGNMAIQHALRDSVQQAIETDINSTDFFNDVVNRTGIWASCPLTSTDCTYSEPAADYNGYTITLNLPRCLNFQPAAGYSALSSGTALEDTYWEVSATGTDPLSGATTTITQGIKMTLPVLNCNGS